MKRRISPWGPAGEGTEEAAQAQVFKVGQVGGQRPAGCRRCPQARWVRVATSSSVRSWARRSRRSIGRMAAGGPVELQARRVRVEAIELAVGRFMGACEAGGDQAVAALEKSAAPRKIQPATARDRGPRNDIQLFFRTRLCRGRARLRPSILPTPGVPV